LASAGDESCSDDDKQRREKKEEKDARIFLWKGMESKWLVCGERMDEYLADFDV
jgi:hypothetical protein